ncbi:MAG TPA: hypothetical protein VIH34_05125, partial [Candidatus Bathyarchaeia archaeon]
MSSPSSHPDSALKPTSEASTDIKITTVEFMVLLKPLRDEGPRLKGGAVSEQSTQDPSHGLG